MVRSIASLAALFLSSGLALAGPQDYMESLPKSVHDMELVETKMVGDTLVAYYGETIGRATLRIMPAPEADKDGDVAEASANTGQTPSAQRALLDFLSRNLSEGTGALGKAYTTNPVRLSEIKLDGDAKLDGTILNCGVVERQVSESAAAKSAKLSGLVDNVCVSQSGDEVIVVSVTTPYADDAMRQKFAQAQITFSGILIGNLLRR